MHNKPVAEIYHVPVQCSAVSFSVAGASRWDGKSERGRMYLYYGGKDMDNDIDVLAHEEGGENVDDD